jgi:transposase
VQLKTILNRVQPHRGFVYGKAVLVGHKGRLALEVEIHPRANGRSLCSGCHRRRPGYDTLEQRRFEFIPLWGIMVFFLYSMRRVECPRCGIIVEEVPWVHGKRQTTTAYQWFLATWARMLSWTDVARAFHTSWETVFRSVEMAVEWGRSHMDLTGITAIGFDEIQWKHGHKYLTLVYQINEGHRRLLWIGQNRSLKTALRFFSWLTPERAAQLQFICSDMWKPYLKVIAKKASRAIHVLDRFHIASHLSKAIDKVRADEARRMKAKGLRPVLKSTRWCLLKNPENLTDKQYDTLVDLLSYNLKTVKAYLLKDKLRLFWTYKSPRWAGLFLDKWCTQVMRSRIEPMKSVAKMLRAHRELILNWFRAKKTISAGCVEGLNNKAKLTTRKAYGFRSFRTIEIALYHTLGKLPEPDFTHRFC